MNLDSLFRFAERHSLGGIVGYALELADVRQEPFQQAKARAIRKALILNAEREAILGRLEQAGIWYMPLKGVVLQNYYPKIGMREMSDNDILFDASRAEDVRTIMEQCGFTTMLYGSGHRDDYHKPPISNFEMHRVLFCPPADEKLLTYYQDVKTRLVKDEGNQYGYHFSNEDFYLYMIAHERKHYDWCGTGIRSLLDIYVFWRRFEQSLDKEYIQKKLTQLGLDEFEHINRSLALALFDNQPLNLEQEQMLTYMEASGTYGTNRHRIENAVTKSGSRIRYIMKRLFLPMSTVEEYYPFFYRHKCLLPFLPVFRLCTKNETAKREIGILMHMKNTKKRK
jgi:hypothetical protein